MIFNVDQFRSVPLSLAHQITSKASSAAFWVSPEVDYVY
jgi:hypothetical protein